MHLKLRATKSSLHVVVVLDLVRAWHCALEQSQLEDDAKVRGYSQFISVRYFDFRNAPLLSSKTRLENPVQKENAQPN